MLPYLFLIIGGDFVSREIKFRVWNKELEEMYELRKVNYLGSVRIIDPYVGGDKSIWMQYTGLKDKKGIEVYEGDKIKGKFKGGQYFVMIVGWNEKKARFDLYTDKRGNRYGFSAGTVDMGTIEIIGNVTEATK